MFGKHISSLYFEEYNIYYNPETLYIIIKENNVEQTVIDLLIINSDLYLCAESFITNYIRTYIDTLYKYTIINFNEIYYS